MKKLTLYILPADKDSFPEIAASSFGKVANIVVFLNHRDLELARQNCETDWYAYLFANEFIQPELREALPTFLESGFSVVSMFQVKWDYDEEDYRFFHSPRLFRKDIALNGMVPKELGKYRTTRILNGYIEG